MTKTPGQDSANSDPVKSVPEYTGPPMREHPFNALCDRFPKDNLNVLVHFYRGELSRSVAWRQKMDNTTHWALITATAMVSVSFSTPSTNHIILPIASLVLLLLLIIEGRRYRFFDVWRTRVRMLEVHFIVPAIAFEHRLPQGNWRETLCNDLFKPTYKISQWEAIARRLQRNYIWLFMITFGSWIAKVLMQTTDGGFIDRFAFRRFSNSTTLLEGEIILGGWYVLIPVLLFNLSLIWMNMYALKTRQATGEIRRKDPRQKVWPI